MKKNKLHSEVTAELEKLQLENEDLKGDLETMTKYREKWEESISIIQDAEGQKIYAQQLEEELHELKEKVKRQKTEIEEMDEQKEEELNKLRDEINSLNDKNIGLIKNESLI